MTSWFSLMWCRATSMRGTARIRDFMTRHVHGFETLEQAADAISSYLPHRRRPRNLEGLQKNLRHREAAGTGTGTRHSSCR